MPLSALCPGHVPESESESLISPKQLAGRVAGQLGAELSSAGLPFSLDAKPNTLARLKAANDASLGGAAGVGEPTIVLLSIPAAQRDILTFITISGEPSSLQFPHLALRQLQAAASGLRVNKFSIEPQFEY